MPNSFALLPPVRTPVLDEKGLFVWQWIQFFNALGLAFWSKAPVNATDQGKAGQIAYDANFIYLCVAANSWKRVGIASW